jgi:ATP-dependent helicase/nuclease subunit A
MRKLVRMAQALRSRSLDEFVAYLLRRREELVTREAQAPLDAPDAVRVLTVHGAKGLEFPVVFVPETDFASPPFHGRVGWDRELGVAVTLAKEDEVDGGQGSRPRPGFYVALKEQIEAEERAEHRRLFYVACTRAGDYLYLSGDEPAARLSRPRESWLAWALPVLEGWPSGEVDVRLPVAVDLAAIARSAPALPELPDAAAEVDYESPLVARPPVIPVRTSTPVTALLVQRDLPLFGHGDGLASFRGVLAHRALQLQYGGGSLPPLVDLAAVATERPVSRAGLERIAGDVEGYLARFAATPLGLALAAGEVEARFEVPFAWDWDGVPVHGVIDLLYRDGAGAWHVVDFKTDALDGRTAGEAVEPYLAQLGLYGLAVERAVGARPTLAACFLRTGDLHHVGWERVGSALADARARVDAGAELVAEPEP